MVQTTPIEIVSSLLRGWAMTNRDIGKQVDAICAEKHRIMALLGQTDKSGYVVSDTSKDQRKRQQTAKTGKPSCTVAYESYTAHVPTKKKTGEQDYLHIPVHKIVFTPIVSGLAQPFSISIVMNSGTIHFTCEGKQYYTVESVVSAFGRYAGVEALQECILQFIVKRSETIK